MFYVFWSPVGQRDMSLGGCFWFSVAVDTHTCCPLLSCFMFLGHRSVNGTCRWVVVFGSVSLLILTLVAHSCHVLCFLVTGRSTGHVAGWLFLVQCRC